MESSSLLQHYRQYNRQQGMKILVLLETQTLLIDTLFIKINVAIAEMQHRKPFLTWIRF